MRCMDQLADAVAQLPSVADQLVEAAEKVAKPAGQLVEGMGRLVGAMGLLVGPTELIFLAVGLLAGTATKLVPAVDEGVEAEVVLARGEDGLSWHQAGGRGGTGCAPGCRASVPASGEGNFSDGRFLQRPRL